MGTAAVMPSGSISGSLSATAMLRISWQSVASLSAMRQSAGGCSNSILGLPATCGSPIRKVTRGGIWMKVRHEGAKEEL
jgi:hypothetical protein